MKRSRQCQQGFAAIAAIFLLVVLAALGAFMLTFSNTQQLNSAQDVQGSRAYWAARGGLEWGLASVIGASACPASPTVLNLDGFTVNVSCFSQVYAEGGANRTIYRLAATASQGGGVGMINYVERSVSATIEP